MSDIKVFAKDYPMAPIDKFIPYANNARTHSKEQINKLRSIYRGIGYGDPVEVDENFTILSGHGRVEAAKAEGMTELPYVMLTGMTEAEKKAYILAVNRSALDAGWDEELLAVEIESLAEMGFDMSLTAFDEKELAALGFEAKAYSFADSNDVSLVTQTACDDCDVIFIPTDNKAADNADAIDAVCRAAKTPIIAGEEGLCAAKAQCRCNVQILSSVRQTGFFIRSLTSK